MSSPQIKRAHSNSSDPQRAARELFQGLRQARMACIIFFCSTDYDLPALAKALAQQLALDSDFDQTPILGCTTAGEITPLGYSRGSITGFSFPADDFVIDCALIENLYTFTPAQAKDLMQGMWQSLQQRAIAPLDGNSFALAMLDGSSIREDQVLQGLHHALPDIPMVGGSAGDNLVFRDTHVFYRGQFYPHAAIMILVNTLRPFRVFSSHHLQLGEEKLVITEADIELRVVRELNAEPAASEYARAIGASIDDLNFDRFALNPLCVRFGNDSYVRSPQKVNDDLSLTFFCAIDTGIVFTLAKPGDIIAHLNGLLDDIRAAIGQPALIIGCDCILRRLEIEQRAIGDKISALLSQNNVIGLNTYGEHFQATHLNQTFTGIAIGERLQHVQR